MNGIHVVKGTSPLEGLPCWVEVDLDAVAHNVRSLCQWVGPRAVVAAVVKAQAYGVGAVEIARTAVEAGVQRLCVARVHEGAELRQEGIQAPILVLGRTDPLEAEEAVRCGLTVTVDTRELAVALGDAATRRGRPVGVHLKVDTGLHHFGVEPGQALPLARALSETQGLRVEGVWTHFASADEPDLSSAREQMECFQQVVQKMDNAGYRFAVHHAANSAATLALPAAHLDLVRVGLSLYGVNPLLYPVAGPTLRPAVALKACVGRVVTLKPGEAVGYAQTWRAQRLTRVGLVTAGYADGVPRGLSNRGCMLVAGQEVPIVGRVRMDHTSIDITDVPGANVGSVATVFGADGDTGLDLGQVAQRAGTIPHDVLTGMGGRVARIYRQKGEVKAAVRLSGRVDLVER